MEKKVPPSPGLVIIRIIIIVMIFKLLIISGIITISFIHICNMSPYDVVVDVIHVADMDEAYGTYAADDE